MHHTHRLAFWLTIMGLLVTLTVSSAYLFLITKSPLSFEERVKQLSRENHLTDKAEKFKKVHGIGDVSAHMMVTYLPELGKVSHQKIAALVGVAPYCNDSGTYKGKSKIRGGREALRSVLYMGMLSAIKHNPVIKAFYDRLRLNGKLHNVAMVACIRKILSILNAMERNNTDWQANYAAEMN